MKKLFFTILLGLLSYPVLMAQFSDNTTAAINQYFIINVNQPVEANLANPKTNPNRGSYVEIMQIGRENNININSLQTGDTQFVNQSGQKNNYEYYNYYSNENSSLQVSQEGNLNSVQVFGENSLMKDAIINQKGSFKALIIKNY